MWLRDRDLRTIRRSGLLLCLLWLGCAHTAPSDSLPGVSSQEYQTIVRHNIDAAALHCNGHRAWSQTLKEHVTETTEAVLGVIPDQRTQETREAISKKVFWRLVRSAIIDGNLNNLGAIRLGGIRTAAGDPILVFRTGLTPNPAQDGSCVHSLIHTGGVRHIVNLYAGEIPTERLEQQEAQAISQVDGTYFAARGAPPDLAHWRDEIRDHNTPEEWMKPAQAAARLINEHILRPDGQSPRGNIHVHCGGGMHRTGMIIGILQRCINHATEAQIASMYRRHVAWQSDANPGGYEQGNLDFIQAFDCTLLQP